MAKEMFFLWDFINLFFVGIVPTHQHLTIRKFYPMTAKDKSQVGLFETTLPNFEYYPVLLPDDVGMNAIAAINQSLVNHGIKPSSLTKLPHVSIDGIVCPENDEKVKDEITQFLSAQKSLLIEFSGLGYFPARGGITLKLGIKNAVEINEFNKAFMDAIGGKTTKLNLHLTLARYVNREIFDDLINSKISFLENCTCKSVAIYKKQLKAKGSYEVIGSVTFGA
jgi:hypothetical protein